MSSRATSSSTQRLSSFGPANLIARSAETHPLTWRLRDDGAAVWLAEYQSKDGYSAARKALTQMAQDEIVQTVKDAGLKGRGGAGFPTGVKWGLMPKDESQNIRYLLCILVIHPMRREWLHSDASLPFVTTATRFGYPLLVLIEPDSTLFLA